MAAAASTFSSSLLPSIKPEKFLLDRPIFFANNCCSPPLVVVNVPMTTACQRRRPVIIRTNCIANHHTATVDAAFSNDDSIPTKTSGGNADILSLLPPDEPRSGVLILVEALQREGVTDVFTNQDQTVLLKALSASSSITTHSFLTHYSEFFAAKGYAIATGLPGVCITSWIPGLTNDLVRGLEHAYDTQIPLVIMVADGWEREKEKITSASKDYGRCLDETIKCRLRITTCSDIPTIVSRAMFVARSGRPGPVLIDRISYDSVRKSDTPVWDVRDQELVSAPPLLPPSVPLRPTGAELEGVIGLLRESKRPLVCAGSGCFEWSEELTRFVELTGIPVVRGVKGVSFRLANDDSFAEIDCCGSVDCCNFALNHFDLLLMLDTDSSYYNQIYGLRSCKSRIYSFDVDDDSEEEEEEEEEEEDDDADDDEEEEDGSVYSIRCCSMKSALGRLNNVLEEGNVSSELDFSAWKKEMNEKRQAPPADHKEPIGTGESVELSDYVVDVVNEITDRRDIFLFTCHTPYRVRFWDWSIHGPLIKCDYYEKRRKETMDVTLPVAAGAAIGKGRRAGTETTVVHIEDEKSVIDSIQELVVLKRENLPVKVVIFNHRTPSSERDPPDFASMAGSFGVPSSRITEKEEVRDAMRVMMETPGPYVLDVIIPPRPCAPTSLSSTENPPRTLEDKITVFMSDLWKHENGDDDEEKEED